MDDSIRGSATAQSKLPDVDATLVEILNGYNWLSSRRDVALGMDVARPLNIKLVDIRHYYEVFKPPVSEQHFIKVVAAADGKYVELQIQAVNNKSNSNNSKEKPTSSGLTSGSDLPALK